MRGYSYKACSEADASLRLQRGLMIQKGRLQQGNNRALSRSTSALLDSQVGILSALSGLGVVEGKHFHGKGHTSDGDNRGKREINTKLTRIARSKQCSSPVQRARLKVDPSLWPCAACGLEESSFYCKKCDDAYCLRCYVKIKHHPSLGYHPVPETEVIVDEETVKDLAADSTILKEQEKNVAYNNAGKGSVTTDERGLKNANNDQPHATTGRFSPINANRKDSCSTEPPIDSIIVCDEVVVCAQKGKICRGHPIDYVRRNSDDSKNNDINGSNINKPVTVEQIVPHRRRLPLHSAGTRRKNLVGEIKVKVSKTRSKFMQEEPLLLRSSSRGGDARETSQGNHHLLPIYVRRDDYTDLKQEVRIIHGKTVHMISST